MVFETCYYCEKILAFGKCRKCEVKRSKTPLGCRFESLIGVLIEPFLSLAHIISDSSAAKRAGNKIQEALENTYNGKPNQPIEVNSRLGKVFCCFTFSLVLLVSLIYRFEKYFTRLITPSKLSDIKAGIFNSLYGSVFLALLLEEGRETRERIKPLFREKWKYYLFGQNASFLALSDEQTEETECRKCSTLVKPRTYCPNPDCGVLWPIVLNDSFRLAIHLLSPVVYIIGFLLFICVFAVVNSAKMGLLHLIPTDANPIWAIVFFGILGISISLLILSSILCALTCFITIPGLDKDLVSNGDDDFFAKLNDMVGDLEEIFYKRNTPTIDRLKRYLQEIYSISYIRKIALFNVLIFVALGMISALIFSPLNLISFCLFIIQLVLPLAAILIAITLIGVVILGKRATVAVQS